ncbi:class I SAM-dependent methyltransferase [Streptomyces flavalbus]|uniref:Class I SAM-dependent methyltransferase n=1 Tax=Streptomyces flavalbus TaxID=2665155 RepID=A0ABW2WGE7_9ACTN
MTRAPTLPTHAPDTAPGPGGTPLTRWLLDALAPGPADRVVELGAGLGTTARLTLARRPAAYTGVDRDPAAVAALSTLTTAGRAGVRAVRSDVTATGQPSGWATVVYGEGALTPRPERARHQIVREAHRLLDPATGRYGIHEPCLLPDGLDAALAAGVATGLGARLLTPAGWAALLAAEGFTVTARHTAPLRPRVRTRAVLRRHRARLGAVALVAVPAR